MVETIIGTVLGTIIGGLVTHIYYLKQKNEQILSNKLNQFIQRQIEDLILSTKYPEFFESVDAHFLHFLNEIPKNKDIPHLSAVVFERKNLTPGELVKILVRVSDNKWNFPLVRGLEIIGLFGEKLNIQHATCGYMLTQFKIPDNFGPGIYSLNATMIDTVGNKNEQKIPIDISYH